MATMRMTISRRTSNRRWGFLAIWVGFVVVAGLGQLIASRRAAPDIGQKIAATLVRWGLSVDGMNLPVESAAVERRLADLRSPHGERRVRAAAWLASRGVRASGGDIAAAMDDPRTLRPCQLAKSLGELGDEHWTDTLVAAMRQQSNADLRVCATLALGDLQSSRTVDALTEAYRSGGMATTALNALSRLAHPASLAFFQQVRDNSPRPVERRIARQAIQRIGVLQQADPAASLIQRLDDQLRQSRLEQWTVRRIAEYRDDRSVAALRRAFPQLQTEEHQVWVAAALLAHGDAGRAALARLAEPRPPHIPQSPVAAAALALTTPSRAAAVPDRPTLSDDAAALLSGQ